MNRALEATTADREQPAGDSHVVREPRKYLTQIQICRRIGISVQTWRNWRQRSEVPEPVNLPGRPRWRVEDIDRFEAQGRIVHTGRKTFFGTAVRRRSA